MAYWTVISCVVDLDLWEVYQCMCIHLRIRAAVVLESPLFNNKYLFETWTPPDGLFEVHKILVD